MMGLALLLLGSRLTSSATFYYSRQSITFSSSMSIMDCIFESCHSSSLGGAIFANSSSYNFSMHLCTFVNCSSSTSSPFGCRTAVSGGAFAISANSILLSRACFNGCYGLQFGYVFFTTTGPNNPHQLNQSSAAHCGDSSEGQGGIFMDYGAELLCYVNATDLKSNNFYSALIPGTYSSVCQIICNQIIRSAGQSILGIGGPCTVPSVKSCNIIDNCPTVGLFYMCLSTVPVYESVFSNNSGVWAQYSAAAMASSTIAFYNCVADRSFVGMSITASNCTSFISNPGTIDFGAMDYCDNQTQIFTLDSRNAAKYLAFSFAVSVSLFSLDL